MGIYIHKARIIGYLATFLLVIINYFTFEKFLVFLNVNERTIKFSLDYIYVCYIYIIFDVYSATIFRYLNIIGKTYVNLIIIIVGLFVQVLFNYIFITKLDLGVTGVGISFTLSRFNSAIAYLLYVSIWNPLPEAIFFINRQCFKGLYEFVIFSITTCFIFCVEWWAMPIQALIAVLISEDDYTVHIIINQIFTLLCTFNAGINLAIAILTSEYIVKASVKINRKLVLYSLLFGFLVVTTLMSIFYYFKFEIYCAFLETNKVIDKGMPIMPIMCIAIVLDNFSAILVGTSRGLAKNTGTGVMFGFICCIFMPLVSYTIAKIMGYGVYGIWTGIMISYACLDVLMLIFYQCLNLEKIKLEIKNRLDKNESEAFITNTEFEHDKITD